MECYIVRVIETRALVGIFFAESVKKLVVDVDEDVPPNLCEYVMMPPGGIIASVKQEFPPNKPGPEVMGDDEPPWMDLADPDLTESWIELFMHSGEWEWYPLPPAPMPPMPDRHEGNGD